MHIPDMIQELERPFISVELLPPRQDREQNAFWNAVETMKTMNPLFTAVTCGAGGSGSMGTLKTSCELVQGHGLTVMPHVTCVHSQLSGLKHHLENIQIGGIRNVLAVRGDYPAGVESAPEGLRYASDLVERIGELAPDVAVGVAAYPDGHPESKSILEDIRFLKHKLDAGAAFGVTQLFFDNRRYFDMIDRLAAMGCNKPVIPSILPVRSMGQIKRVMELCDAPVPGKFLHAIEAAHAKGGDDAVKEYGIGMAADQISSLLENGAPGVHLYPFNRAEMCVEVMQRAGLAA